MIAEVGVATILSHKGSWICEKGPTQLRELEPSRGLTSFHRKQSIAEAGMSPTGASL